MIRAGYLAAASLLAFATCPPPVPPDAGPSPAPTDAGASPKPARVLVGKLEVDGPNAFINSRRAVTGDAVYIGDEVATGASTSAVLAFDGGYVWLDVDTDPQILRETWCLLIRIFKGRAVVSGDGVCVQSNDLSATLNSVANVEASGSTTTLTMVKGAATVTPRTAHPPDAPATRPGAPPPGASTASVRVEANHRIVSAGGKLHAPIALSHEQVLRTVDWTARYRITRTPLPLAELKGLAPRTEGDPVKRNVAVPPPVTR